jgi:hypothetical protein
MTNNHDFSVTVTGFLSAGGDGNVGVIDGVSDWVMELGAIAFFN